VRLASGVSGSTHEPSTENIGHTANKGNKTFIVSNLEVTLSTTTNNTKRNKTKRNESLLIELSESRSKNRLSSPIQTGA
jgi:hypothetical protein